MYVRNIEVCEYHKILKNGKLLTLWRGLAGFLNLVLFEIHCGTLSCAFQCA